MKRMSAHEVRRAEADGEITHDLIARAAEVELAETGRVVKERFQ